MALPYNRLRTGGRGKRGSRWKSANGALLAMALLFAVLVSVFSAATAAGKLVYVIPVEHTIETGLEKFLQRGFAEAREAEADAIVLEVNTPGGEVQAAGEIGNLIRQSEIPVTAYILDEAFSAGTYISLNAEKIVMAPGSAMGAAAPIDLAGNMADEKIVATWTKKMTAAAELRGRDPQIAEAMVNPDVEIPGLVRKGELLALDAQEALQHGYADYIAKDLDEVLSFLGLKGATVVKIEPTAGEKVARFLTNPFVIPVLLMIGLAGITAELLAPGFGWPGVIGVAAFSLYFLGNWLAGFANGLHLILFVLGILLLLIEVFVPGFGVFGGLGIVSLVAGVVMAAYDTTLGLFSLGIAVAVALVVGAIVVKYFGHRGVWNRFILKERQDRASGYVASEDYGRLVGKSGIALTPLRPAGTVAIDDQRYDVVSEGGFVRANERVKVVKIEGSRIVVRPERKEDE